MHLAAALLPPLFPLIGLAPRTPRSPPPPAAYHAADLPRSNVSTDPPGRYEVQPYNHIILSTWSWWDPTTCDLSHADRPAWDPTTLNERGQTSISSFFPAKKKQKQ